MRKEHKEHKEHKAFACDEPGCDYRTAQSGNLTAHRRKHNPETMLKCDEPGCDYRAAHSGHLTVHRRTHNPETMLKCDEPGCDYRAAQSGNLTVHRRTHYQESRLKCDHPGCDYRTAHSGDLTAHRRKHNPETMLKCDEPGCDYRAAQSGHLTVHRRKHNPESRLKCDEPGCDYQTAQSGHLTAHRRKHYPESRLKCDEPGCDYRTAHSGNLNRHRMTMHPVPQPVFFNPAVLPARSGSPVLSSALPGHQRAASPFQEKEIKQERPDSPLLRTLKRTLDDNGPILRNPARPSESMMGLAERPVDELRVTHWGGLQADGATKLRINEEIRQWLRDEGNHAVRFARMLYVMRPLDDGPERGDSVFAKVNLPPWTLLGPYAGILHDDTQSNSLSAERRAYGTSNVHRYTFQTGSVQRLVSAYASGNVLSLINTATLAGYAPIAGKNNNVSCIRAGKNITFYVTNTFIPEGEELFIDYGPDYESGPNAKRLKQEAL